MGTRLVAGRYELGETIGAGGMGVVWRAQDLVLGRTVALKEIRMTRAPGERSRAAEHARALREARAAAQLSHPNVVGVYDVIDDGERIFIVMEHVAAPTLEEVVARTGPLDPKRAARYGLDLVAALNAAHARGIVHRDVKPANVMIEPDGRARLTDFGIASVQGDPRLTQTGVLIGSPHFMAPERATGAPAGPASDVWSLGATLYYAVEGTRPFDGEGAVATLSAVVSTEPAPPERAGPLAALIVSLLDKDPGTRPRLDEVRAALQQVAADSLAAGRDPPPAAPRRDVTQARRGRRRRRRIWLAAALAALLAMSLAAAALLARREAGRRPAGPRPGARPSAPAIPPGWQTYRDPEIGYVLRYPPGWQVVERTSFRIDFVDAVTRTYLRVEWTRSPGPSARAAWESLSDTFAATRAGYELIGITDTSFTGSDEAALWEYTYLEGGADLHAYNLGFVLHGYGFALNLQAHEEHWERALELWPLLKRGFQPPAS